MSTPKFTPGPWKARAKSITSVGGMVALVSRTDNCYKADAALIAAAPDLWAALTVVVRRLEAGQIEQLTDLSELSYLKELLAKAEGEKQ
jgi:hypothetical protein